MMPRVVSSSSNVHIQIEWAWVDLLYKCAYLSKDARNPKKGEWILLIPLHARTDAGYRITFTYSAVYGISVECDTVYMLYV